MTITTTLLLMYEIAQNNKIRNTRHYDTSNHFTSENKSNNTTHADSIINTDSFGGRILIVDDDPDITLSFSIGLEDGGFEVSIYNDPQDALANFKPSFYDLLLVDINMPKMNGFELCTKISEVDLNVKICFYYCWRYKYRWTKGYVSCIKHRMLYQKPVTISDLVKRLKAELE